MRGFSINCDFGGQISPFTVYIGQPKPGNHALANQSKWLGSERQGMIPAEVMDAVSKLQELADKNGVLLEELCVYALGTEETKATEMAADNQEVPSEEPPVTEDEDSEDQDSTAAQDQKSTDP